MIDGFKRYISNATKSDVYIVWGITDPTVAPQRGMTAVAVPATAAGMSFPRTYDFMGRRGCVVGEVDIRRTSACRRRTCSAARTPASASCSAPSTSSAPSSAAPASGWPARPSTSPRAHAQTRTAFGEKLGQKQLIWNMIAEMSWRIDAAELLTYRAAKMYDAGIDGKELMREAAQAKLVSTETAVFCADRTVQVLGGDGVTRQYGRAEQIYRDARALPIVGGSSEMAKYLIAAREMPAIKPNL